MSVNENNCVQNLEMYRIVSALAVFYLLSPWALAASFIDSSVSGIELMTPKSTKKILADRAWKQIKKNETDFPSAVFCNSNRTEQLTLVFHPGDVVNSFAEFKVKKIDKNAKCETTSIEKFVTSRKITLGMKKSELMKTLGKPTKETAKDVIEYRLESESHPFLEKHSMPIYYGQYHFSKGKLVKMAFGFEYP